MEAILTKAEASLELKRVFKAPVSQVYKAWTDPKMLDKWFHPAAGMTSTSQVDLRQGGSYHIIMHGSRGDFTVAGKYEEVIPEKKLVFTWQWQGEEEYETTRVTVLFRPLGPNATELTLIHGDFDTQEERDSHGDGWLGTFEQLAAELAA